MNWLLVVLSVLGALVFLFVVCPFLMIFLGFNPFPND